MKSMSAPFEISEENDREIQLTLVNKFKEKIEDEISTGTNLMVETKELVIGVFRGIPNQEKKDEDGMDDLPAILAAAQQYGRENNQPALVTNVEKIIANLKQLEKEGKIMGSNDRYQGFLRGIAKEVANRQEIREQQRKERMRLTAALRDLRKHGAYLNEQISQYHNYLKDVLHHYSTAGKKGPAKPVKFSYKDLAQKGVILASDVPKLGQKTMTFSISSESPGVFDIEAKLASKTVDTIQLELDDLLDRANSNNPVLKLENVTLDVNLTLHLLNKYFLKKVK